MKTRTPNRFLTAAAMAVAWLAMPADHAHARPGDEDPPATIVVTGVVRDFRERSVEGGHPDFENRPDRGFGHYGGNVGATLGPGGKPYHTGAGRKITAQWRDDEHRPICAALYEPALNDIQGRWGQPSDGGITSAASFDQWFRDVPGVNLSKALPLTLVRQIDGTYVFDDRTDPVYAERGGFFPIDGELFGDSAGTPRHNFHFTFELHANFVYDADGAQWFKFTGDDDVWVYIEDRLVIDLGGVHASLDQHLDLSRLGLVDGETYTLHFFHAERFRPDSSFRIQTNMLLSPTEVRVPTVTEGYD